VRPLRGPRFRVLYKTQPEAVTSLRRAATNRGGGWKAKEKGPGSHQLEPQVLVLSLVPGRRTVPADLHTCPVNRMEVIIVSAALKGPMDVM
jgi:hypothetical protein